MGPGPSSFAASANAASAAAGAASKWFRRVSYSDPDSHCSASHSRFASSPVALKGRRLCPGLRPSNPRVPPMPRAPFATTAAPPTPEAPGGAAAKGGGQK
jgi:hypothetical protein